MPDAGPIRPSVSTEQRSEIVRRNEAITHSSISSKALQGQCRADNDNVFISAIFIDLKCPYLATCILLLILGLLANWVVMCWRGYLSGARCRLAAQLMPLPLTVSCFSEIQIGFTFLVLARPDSPGKRAVKRLCVCVCVRVRVRVRVRVCENNDAIVFLWCHSATAVVSEWIVLYRTMAAEYSTVAVPLQRSSLVAEG